MFRAPSNASHDGAARLRHARGARNLVRLLQGLAFAIVTIVVAGIASPARSIPRQTFAVDTAAQDGSGSARWAAFGSEQVPRSHRWRDGAARSVADLKALESDDDDDDGDTLFHVVDDPTVAVKDPTVLRGSGRTLRAHGPIDPSRFAAGTGLPRGPPV